MVIIVGLLVFVVALLGVSLVILERKVKFYNERVNNAVKLTSALAEIVRENVLPVLSSSSEARIRLLDLITDVDARAMVTITYLFETSPEFKVWLTEYTAGIRAEREANNTESEFDVDIEQMLKDIQVNQKKKGDTDA